MGIFIAFQLEDYQNDRQELEDLEIVLTAIEKEVQNNLKIYEENIDKLGYWVEYYDLSKNRDKNNRIRIERKLYDLEKTQNAEAAKRKYANWEIIDSDEDYYYLKGKHGDMISFFPNMPPAYRLNYLPNSNISSGSWLAGINSGALNRLENRKMAALYNIYNTIDQNLGLYNTFDLYGEMYRDPKRMDMDIDVLAERFRDIVSAESYKVRIIKEQIGILGWSI
jgi:hypothetical protein